jgi:hypothetical protein
MNLPTAFFRTAEAQRQPVTPVPAAIARGQTSPRIRDREFGVGYGNSSGYASGRHYAEPNPAAPFRIR